jgi:hypothetical protein
MNIHIIIYHFRFLALPQFIDASDLAEKLKDGQAQSGIDFLIIGLDFVFF